MHRTQRGFSARFAVALPVLATFTLAGCLAASDGSEAESVGTTRSAGTSSACIDPVTGVSTPNGGCDTSRGTSQDLCAFDGGPGICQQYCEEGTLVPWVGQACLPANGSDAGAAGADASTPPPPPPSTETTQPFEYGSCGPNDSQGFGDFLALEPGTTPGEAPTSGLCHIYTYWDIANRPPPGHRNPDTTHDPSKLRSWFEDAKTKEQCSEVLVTFQGAQKDGNGVEASPDPGTFAKAVQKFLAPTAEGGALGFWHGKIALTAWNEPNNKANGGNGLNEELSAQRAAEYYLSLENLCDDPSQHLGCKVAAGDFASNGHWGDYMRPDSDNFKNAGTLEWNCADPTKLKDSGNSCDGYSRFNPSHWGPSYLDRYMFHLASEWKQYPHLKANTASGFRPAHWAYHAWHDVNSYVDSGLSCADYAHCGTRRLLWALGGDWAKSDIWDTEIAVPQPGHDGISDNDQACGAAFLVQLTLLSPRIDRVYYMWFGRSPGYVFDNGRKRPAADVLAQKLVGFTENPEKPADEQPACVATGMLATYSNPIIPMFKLEEPEDRGPVPYISKEPTEGCPDPTGLLAHDNRFYIYCTSYSLASHRYNAFPIFRADTLAHNNWDHVADIIPPSGPSMSSWPAWIAKDDGQFWAPDVHEIELPPKAGEKQPRYVYVALYAAPHKYRDGKKLQSIGMSWASSPTGAPGGWKHLNHVFISACREGSKNCNPPGANENGSTYAAAAYDPNLLQTSDKKLYLYWTVEGHGIYAREVKLTAKEDGEIELTGKPAEHVSDIGEGGYAFEHDSEIFLFYSTSEHPSHNLLYTYQVRVQKISPKGAGLPDPMAPARSWVVDSDAVLQKSAVADGHAVHELAFVATGGNSIIHNAVGGHDYMVYHGVVAPQTSKDIGRSSSACDNPEDTRHPNKWVKASASWGANPYCRGQGDRQAMIDPIAWLADAKGEIWPVVNGYEKDETKWRTPSTGQVFLPGVTPPANYGTPQY